MRGAFAVKHRFSLLFLVLTLLLSFPVSAQEEAAEEVEGPLFQTVYVTSPGKPVSFNSDDFQLLCRQATGHDLKSLTFTALPRSAGTYRYTPEDKELQLIPGVELFPYQKPTLYHTAFHPAAGFTGVTEAPFVMTSEKEETAEGMLLLCVLPAGEEPSSGYDFKEEHTSTAGQPVPLLELFPFPQTGWEAYNPFGGKTVNSVTFSLPLSEEGSLWLHYGDSDARKILPKEALFSDGELNFYDLTFVPAREEANQVSLRYTVRFKGKEDLTGVINLNFTKKKTISRPPVSPSEPEPAPARFTDLEGWEWAAPAAEELNARYALRLDPEDTLFRPGDEATRMELLHSLVQTAYPGNYDPGVTTFPDLPQNPSYARSAAFAYVRELALGDEAGRLNPDDPITRQDALVLLYRALSAQKGGLPSPGDLSQFSDQNDLAPYAREAAGVLLSAGILEGNDAHQLQPRSPITRAEMAVLICRAFPG